MSIYVPGSGTGQRRAHDVPFVSSGVYVPLITAKNRTWNYLKRTHIHPDTNPNLRKG